MRESAPFTATVAWLALVALPCCDSGSSSPDSAEVLESSASSGAPAPAAQGDPTGTPTEASGPTPELTGEITPVVIIVVDTLRADHLGCYGCERDTSPNLDRLAADSTLYRRAISQAPWTTPSIGSLMTSRYPSALGIRDARSILDEEVVLLAEVLAPAGYTNSAVISHSFCSARWGFAQGFHEFDESMVVGHDAICGPGVTDRALQILDQQKGERFFLWLHYFDPHFAYLSHPEYPFDPDPDYDGPITPGMPFGDLLRTRHRLKDPDLAELTRMYDSEIRLTDEAIGRVLDRLRELNLYDRSLIVFTGDHGEEFMEHGDLGHTKNLYGEVMHVPLLIKLPNGVPQKVDRAVGLIDVYPTVLDVLGLTIEHDIAGRSLLKEPRAAKPRPVFFETSRKRILRGIVKGNLKMIHDVEADSYMMFDLEADPGEKKDIYSKNPDEKRALKGRLRRWITETMTLSSGQLDSLSPEEIARLRAMGYAVDDG